MEHGLGTATGVGQPLHVSVDAVAVGPVSLDGDEAEAPLDDEPLRQLGAPGVKLRGPVRRLTEKDEARVTDTVEQRLEARRRRQRASHPSEGFAGISFDPLVRFCLHAMRPPGSPRRV